MDDNKFKGRKFKIAIWAASIFTILAIWSLATKECPEWMGTCMPMLLSVPVGFVAVQGWIDKTKAVNK